MDIHLRVTLTMVTAAIAGQITTYFSLHVFPTVWDLFDNKLPECDASSIVIMRLSGSKTSAGDCGGGGASRGRGSRGAGGAADPQQASRADPPDRAGPARTAVCTCFGFVDCPDDGADAVAGSKATCPQCKRQRRPRSRRAAGAARKTAVSKPVESQCKAGDVETYQVRRESWGYPTLEN